MSDYTLRVLVTATNIEQARTLASEIAEYEPPTKVAIIDVYIEEGWDE